jgi:uncharacterized membrane protein
VSTTVVVVLSVSLVSTILVLGVVYGLVKQLKVLAAALGRYREEVTPLLEEINAGADTASRRASELPGRVPGPGPGARLRNSS